MLLDRDAAVPDPCSRFYVAIAEADIVVDADGGVLFYFIFVCVLLQIFFYYYK